jgi:hypothetical protein
MFSLSQTGNRAAYLAVRGYMGYINTVDFGLADPRYISEFSATFLSFSGKKDAGCCNVLIWYPSEVEGDCKIRISYLAVEVFH